jgi:hypothetical protein
MYWFIYDHLPVDGNFLDDLFRWRIKTPLFPPGTIESHGSFVPHPEGREEAGVPHAEQGCSGSLMRSGLGYICQYL